MGGKSRSEVPSEQVPVGELGCGRTEESTTGAGKTTPVEHQDEWVADLLGPWAHRLAEMQSGWDSAIAIGLGGLTI
jgi:hypothetical protein